MEHFQPSIRRRSESTIPRLKDSRAVQAALALDKLGGNGFSWRRKIRLRGSVDEHLRYLLSFCFPGVRAKLRREGSCAAIRLGNMP